MFSKAQGSFKIVHSCQIQFHDYHTLILFLFIFWSLLLPVFITRNTEGNKNV
jgi:hypothetical protein